MGQHIHLASAITETVGREYAEQLVTEYEVAPRNLGVLRLSPGLMKRRFR